MFNFYTFINIRFTNNSLEYIFENIFCLHYTLLYLYNLKCIVKYIFKYHANYLKCIFKYIIKYDGNIFQM